MANDTSTDELYLQDQARASQRKQQQAKESKAKARQG